MQVLQYIIVVYYVNYNNVNNWCQPSMYFANFQLVDRNILLPMVMYTTERQVSLFLANNDQVPLYPRDAH